MPRIRLKIIVLFVFTMLILISFTGCLALINNILDNRVDSQKELCKKDFDEDYKAAITSYENHLYVQSFINLYYCLNYTCKIKETVRDIFGVAEDKENVMYKSYFDIANNDDANIVKKKILGQINACLDSGIDFKKEKLSTYQRETIISKLVSIMGDISDSNSKEISVYKIQKILVSLLVYKYGDEDGLDGQFIVGVIILLKPKFPQFINTESLREIAADFYFRDRSQYEYKLQGYRSISYNDDDVEKLRLIIDTYPETVAAKKARKELSAIKPEDENEIKKDADEWDRIMKNKAEETTKEGYINAAAQLYNSRQELKKAGVDVNTQDAENAILRKALEHDRK